MFCSNCGKSLAGDAEKCPSCGAAVGESRFDGYPYTSAQPKLHPGKAVRLYGNHFSTEFIPDEEPDGQSAETASIYRAGSAPRAVGYDEDDKRAALYDDAKPETEPENEPEAEPEAKPRKRIFNLKKPAPAKEEPQPEEKTKEKTKEEPEEFEVHAPAGISDDVRSYMERLKEEREADALKARQKAEKKAAQKPRKEELPPEPVEEFEDAEEPKPKFSLKDVFKKSAKPEDEGEAEDEELDVEFEDEDGEYGEEEFMKDETRKQRGKLLKTLLIALIAVALVAGAVIGVSGIREKTKTAPVSTVTLSLWNEGIELMQYRVSETYRNNMLSGFVDYATGYVGIAAQMTADREGLDELLPANPLQDDSRFIEALKAIQLSINNCISNDLLALTDSTTSADEKQTKSDNRWQTARDYVTALTQATNAGMLDAIIKGTPVELIQQVTPTPEPTAPTYTTLAKGSGDSAAVTKLQTRLTELGYMTSAIDGDFGSKTKTAVEKFQQAAGLTVSGIADAATQELLYSDDAPKAN